MGSSQHKSPHQARLDLVTSAEIKDISQDLPLKLFNILSLWNESSYYRVWCSLYCSVKNDTAYGFFSIVQKGVG